MISPSRPNMSAHRKVTYMGIFSGECAFFLKAFNRAVSFINSGLQLIILSGLHGFFQYETAMMNKIWQLC